MALTENGETKIPIGELVGVAMHDIEFATNSIASVPVIDPAAIR
jgi:hypothetical protein